jgi:hypothetical protein
MATSDDDALRAQLASLLEGSLETEHTERAYDSEAVNNIVGRLRRVAKDDLTTKLKVAGFTARPYEADDISQACETCMYYLRHRKYCELPELDIPVEPRWACRLWRI